MDVLVFDEDGKFMERVKVDGGELTPSGTEDFFFDTFGCYLETTCYSFGD